MNRKGTRKGMGNPKHTVQHSCMFRVLLCSYSYLRSIFDLELELEYVFGVVRVRRLSFERGQQRILLIGRSTRSITLERGISRVCAMQKNRRIGAYQIFRV
jgi:hypothetical protein